MKRFFMFNYLKTWWILMTINVHPHTIISSKEIFLRELLENMEEICSWYDIHNACSNHTRICYSPRVGYLCMIHKSLSVALHYRVAHLYMQPLAVCNRTSYEHIQSYYIIIHTFLKFQ